jgi:hypothetical protein
MLILWATSVPSSRTVIRTYRRNVIYTFVVSVYERIYFLTHQHCPSHEYNGKRYLD